MFAKIFLLFAAVAAANATGLYSSGLLGHGLYGSGIIAPGLLNSAIAPGYYHGAPLLSAPISTTYTTKSVIAAPAAITRKSIFTAPVAYAAPAAIATRSVLAAAPIAYAAPAAITTKSVVAAAPLAYAAPVAPLSYAAPAAITSHRTVIGATSLLTGSPLVYGPGMIAAAPYSGVVSPIGLKGTRLLAGPDVLSAWKK